jgi:hypothetical protein
MVVLWGAAPCSLAIITLMMEAVSSSETSPNIYKTTQCYIPEDSHLHIHHHENIKSHLYLGLFIYSLFNGAFSSSDYIVLNEIMDNELERIWKEAVMA